MSRPFKYSRCAVCQLPRDTPLAGMRARAISDQTRIA